MTPTPETAGAEMDRMVAEKVMGYEFMTGSVATMYPDHYLHPGGTKIALVEFQPSTRISHAWYVVEHLHAKGWHIVLINCPGCDEHREKGWACDMISPDDARCAIGVHADTAPLAIALAALRAVGQ